MFHKRLFKFNRTSLGLNMSKSKSKPKSKTNLLDRIAGWGDSNTDFNVIPDEDLTDEELEVKYNHPFI